MCVSAAACPHYCMDPNATWVNGRGCFLVVHYWEDFQSVNGFRCYDNIARRLLAIGAYDSTAANAKCQRVGCMLVPALFLV